MPATTTTGRCTPSAAAPINDGTVVASTSSERFRTRGWTNDQAIRSPTIHPTIIQTASIPSR